LQYATLGQLHEILHGGYFYTQVIDLYMFLTSLDFC
jgi:hypothetical protein